MNGDEEKAAKLQSLEEEAAAIQDQYMRGEISQNSLEIALADIDKKIRRVKSMDYGAEEPIEGERDEARVIWEDIQKQYAEGKMSEGEFQKYKKMFEDYVFDAPKEDWTPLDTILLGGLVAFIGGLVLLTALRKREMG